MQARGHSKGDRRRIHELSTAVLAALSDLRGSTRLARKGREGSIRLSDSDDITAGDDASVPGPDTADQAAADLDVALREALGPEPAAEGEPVESTPGEAAGQAVVESPAPPVVVPDSADAALVEAVGGGLTWVPFACYLGLWVVLAGLSAYLLYGADSDTPARWLPAYVPLLWSGVGLTALGPVLSVAVWAFTRARRPREARRGLFASAVTRGSLVAFFGVAIWIATLFVLELVATGGTL